ncbi:Glycosyltransferase involved in cell wall bisynthesis [Dyadobacter koreensis]|uniref:Glycosyltransferase involved in cell wall bisynthesis n=1 Tax=Dyadobacter koreensis TaxID=408657 RepID=A0A1H6V4V5_9BACT|nr:glycosyltransferase [Dyadobacter koreensis]SEI99613.1 Glycosyltransferase involved in cell wall bisynthesis [Dyadobacter koreensis]
MNEPYIFPNITLLVTHYNRSSSLERLLISFEKLNCKFSEVVVSDDGSQSSHLDYLKSIQHKYNFSLITTPVNKGLGNNINKGQDAVSSPFTLYVQEDFVPKSTFPDSLQKAVEILEQRPEIDMARFYAYFKYPFLKPLRDGFSEILFSLLLPGYRKFYVYSDHPHLRKTTFLEKFGRYHEGVKGDVTEYDMMMSFLKKKGKAIFYDDINGLFDQVNSSEEPSTMKRNFLRENNNFLMVAARNIYRHLKFNFDYLFS